MVDGSGALPGRPVGWLPGPGGMAAPFHRRALARSSAHRRVGRGVGGADSGGDAAWMSVGQRSLCGAHRASAGAGSAPSPARSPAETCGGSGAVGNGIIWYCPRFPPRFPSPFPPFPSVSPRFPKMTGKSYGDYNSANPTPWVHYSYNKGWLTATTAGTTLYQNTQFDG